jgi:hypothetical protein
VQVELGTLQPQFVGFQTGQIQEVVDERQQRIATTAYGSHKLALLMRE